MARELKDSGVRWVGMIPSSWSVHRNKNCFKCSKEIVGDKSAEMQLLSLTTKGIKEKRPEDSTGKVPETYDTYQVVVPNDIVMCLFDLDVSAVFSGISPYFGMISPAYKVLKCRSNLIVPRYSAYWFSYVFDGRKFKHYAKNLRYTLNYDEFAVLPIILPSIDEQVRIADYLDTECSRIDSVVEQTRASIEDYKNLKQAIITQAVTKGIRPNREMKDSGIEWVGEIPNNWTKVKLGHICSFHNGDRSSNYPAATDFIDEGIPFIGADSLNGRYVNTSIAKHISREKYETMGGLKIQNGDILYTLRGSTIGKNSIANFSDGTVASSLMGIRIRRSDLITPTYLYYWLASEQEFLQRDLAINGSTAPNLSAEDVKLYRLFLPTLEEQKRIVEHLDSKTISIDLAVEKKMLLILEIEEYKKALIYEYVTGKKEVSNVDYSA